MSENFEPRLVAVEKDIEYLRRSVVDHNAVVKLIEPIREEQAKQASAITDLARDMSLMAAANKTTNETVQGVLKTYNDGLVAAANAEKERLKSATVGAVFEKASKTLAQFTAAGGGIVLLYAVARWILTNTP